jgi:transposase/predicted phosphodiesterase
MRYVTLKTEEINALEELNNNTLDNSTRKRSHCLLLSHQKRTITDLAKVFDVSRRTIERWFDDWAESGLDSLPILPGRGVKTRLKGYEQEIAKQLVLHHSNIKNVLHYFEEEHNIKICRKTLQNFLKVCGLFFCFFITFHIGLAQENPAISRNPSVKVFSFGIVTDIQYADAEKKGNRDYRNSLGKLEKCVNEFNGHDLAFIINLGDLIDHDFISYEKPLAILDNLKAPLYNVIGNHDFEVDDQVKDQVRKHLKNKNGFFSIEVNRMIFIVLDGSDVSTMAYPKGSKQFNNGMAKYEKISKSGLNNAYTWNGAIGDQQLKWLVKLLGKADKLNKKAVIFCHWPLLPENGTQLWNNREVLSLINTHPSVVAWIAGHHHAGGYEKAGTIHYLTLKGMVEARSATSCGIVEVLPDKLVLKGYGDQNDQILQIF